MTVLVGAKEGSTFVLTVTFEDENRVAFVPVTCKWTLANKAGAIVNGRQDVVITSPTASVTIVLSGLDLAANQEGNLSRILMVTGTYDSAAGSNLPFAGEVSFAIDPTPLAR